MYWQDTRFSGPCKILKLHDICVRKLIVASFIKVKRYGTIVLGN